MKTGSGYKVVKAHTRKLKSGKVIAVKQYRAKCNSLRRERDGAGREFEKEQSNKVTAKKILGTSTWIEYGSGSRSTIDGWNRENLKTVLMDAFEHYFVDGDFYYNSCKDSKAYRKEVKDVLISPLLKNLDSALSIFKLARTPSSMSKDVMIVDENNVKFGRLLKKAQAIKAKY